MHSLELTSWKRNHTPPTLSTVGGDRLLLGNTEMVDADVVRMPPPVTLDPDFKALSGFSCLF